VRCASGNTFVEFAICTFVGTSTVETVFGGVKTVFGNCIRNRILRSRDRIQNRIRSWGEDRILKIGDTVTEVGITEL
jgi:hypothetical protein